MNVVYCAATAVSVSHYLTVGLPLYAPVWCKYSRISNKLRFRVGRFIFGRFILTHPVLRSQFLAVFRH